MKTNSFFQKNRTLQSGNVLIIVMVLFVVLSVSIAIGLVVPVIRANRTAENNLQSKRSYAFAESGIEDVVYRLKSSMDVSTSETLVLGSQEVTTSVSDVSGGNKQVVAIGNVNERNRTIAVTVSQGVGVSFNYGVQTGRGGVTMSNNSQIVGNVYSHGNVTGSGFITGAAIAANSDALFADQINDTPITPPSSINVRRTSATVDFAQG